MVSSATPGRNRRRVALARRGSDRLPILALLAASCLVIAVVASHGAAVIRHRLASASEGAPEPTPYNKPPHRANLDAAKTWRPFGEPVADVARFETLVAASTPLDIKLRGVIAGRGSHSGVAIIADADGNEATYGIGESLGSTTTIVAIERQNVIVKRGNSLETLSMAVLGGNDSNTPATAQTLPLPTAALITPLSRHEEALARRKAARQAMAGTEKPRE